MFPIALKFKFGGKSEIGQLEFHFAVDKEVAEFDAG